MVGRQRDRAALGARRGRGEQVLAAIFDPLEGLAEVVAGEHNDLFVACEVGLLAEAAADVAHLHPDPALGHAGDAAGHGAHVVRRLGGDVHIERTCLRLPRGHDPASLHRHCEIAVLHVVLGQHVRSRLEERAQLVVGRHRHRARDVAVRIGMHAFRALERGRVVDDRGERLDVELDELEGILRQCPSLGHDERVRIADVAHFVVGQHLVRPGGSHRQHGGRTHRAHEHVVQVDCGQHGNDTVAPRVRQRRRRPRCVRARCRCARTPRAACRARRRRRRSDPARSGVADPPCG